MVKKLSMLSMVESMPMTMVGNRGEVAYGVVVIVCVSWLGAVALCRVEGCLEG